MYLYNQWRIMANPLYKYPLTMNSQTDNNDGGPAKGGEFIMAINPQLVAGDGWEEHCEEFFRRIKSIEGVRLPGERRHKNRLDKGPRKVNKDLLERIRQLI